MKGPSEEELAALGDDVTKTKRAELMPLDRSYASIERIEQYYFLVLDGHLQTARARRSW